MIALKEWISIETRWPDTDIKIIGINMNQDEPYIFESEWDDGYWTNIGGEEFTHWMPSPELPK